MVVLKNLAKFARKHLRCSPIFSKFTKYKTPLLALSCEFCETFTAAFLKKTSGQLLLKYQIGMRFSLLVAISLINGVNVVSILYELVKQGNVTLDSRGIDFQVN